MTSETELTPMPEDWHRALAVVAHPDDLEYGAASAVARWTDQGRSVAYLLASKGEAGIDSIPPEQCAPLRVREQIASARVVGVEDVEFLDHPDGTITDQLALRRDIAAAIRRHRPELVLTINHRGHWDGGGRNTADHRNVGAATLDAVADAGNRWIFPDVDAAPWGGVRRVAVSASPLPTHAVDVTDTLDRGIASLREHRTYLDGLGDHPMSDPSFLRTMAEAVAVRFGGTLATSFELIDV